MQVALEIICVPTKDKTFAEWPKMLLPNGVNCVRIPLSNWHEAANYDTFASTKGKA